MHFLTIFNKLCGRQPLYASAPCDLTFDLLTLKEVSESPVTRATSVSIWVSLGLSLLDLGPMYATDRRRTSDVVRRATSLNATALYCLDEDLPRWFALSERTSTCSILSSLMLFKNSTGRNCKSFNYITAKNWIWRAWKNNRWRATV